jgi:Skp family chaperone for outer membrane proteins
MKIKLLLTFVFLLLASMSVFAQAPATQAGVPKLKIAIIDVLSFREQILELKTKYDKLQTEFAPKYRELETVQSSIAQKQKVLEENKTLTPPQQQKLVDEIEQLKRVYNRSLEDSQAQAQKREKEETEAIYDKLSKFLDQYCAKHGITSVFDARRLQETGVVVYVKLPEANITADFVKEYNKAYPVQSTASK